MAKGSNKVILDVLVKARAETAAIGKAKGAMKGLGGATKKAGKDMHHFRIITADTQRRIGALRNVLLLIKFAIATMGLRMLIRQMGTWVKAWAEQEQAVNRLNASLAGVGRYTEQTSKAYQKMAADMQKASVFGDEAIMEVMQTLMTLGNVADKDMKKATQAVLDFSAATGRDLAMATLLVSKAAVGYTGELSRYGIMIDKSLSKTEKFAATLEFLAGMKGRAEAETYTLSGAIKQLGNSYGDAKEKVGQMITESTNLVPALKLMNEWIVMVASNTATSGKIILDLGSVFTWLLKVMNEVTFHLRILGNMIQIVANILGVFAAAIVGIGALFVRGFLAPIRQVMKGLSGFFTWMAEKTTWLADLIANVPFDFPGKDIMIEGLDAIGTAFRGIGTDSGALFKILDTIDKDAKGTFEDVKATINSFPAAIKKNLQDMMKAGASYREFEAEIERLILLYPELIDKLEASKKALKDNATARATMTAIKQWADLLKESEKYYKLTSSEERKKRKEAIDTLEIQMKANEKALIATHEKQLDKIKDLEEFSKKAQEFSALETQQATENAKRIARARKQSASDIEANWKKGMRAIKSYHKLSRSEEIAARKEEINIWAETQLEKTNLSKNATKAEIRYQMQQRKELIEKLKKLRAEIPFEFPETFGQAVESGLDKLVLSYGNSYDRIAKMTQDLAKTMQSTMSEVFFDAFTGELKTTAEYYQAFAKTMLKTTMDYVTKEIMAFAIGKRAEEGLERESAIKKMAIKAWEFAGRQKLRVLDLAAESVSAIKSVAISAWAAIKKVALAMWAFAAKVVEAYASLGVWGIPAAVGTIAAGYALVSASKMAKGGIVTESTNAIIGEAGPEAVVPLSRGPGGKLGIANYGGASEGGGGNIVENHYYINAVDSRSFADLVESNPAVISEVVNRNIRRNGNNRSTMKEFAR